MISQSVPAKYMLYITHYIQHNQEGPYLLRQKSKTKFYIMHLIKFSS